MNYYMIYRGKNISYMITMHSADIGTIILSLYSILVYTCFLRGWKTKMVYMDKQQFGNGEIFK